MSKYKVCPLCDGKGKYVNPSIDSNGLTSEDFAEDPDFAEAYWSGVYDKMCEMCQGRNVVTEAEELEYKERLDDHRVYLMESGIYSGFDGRL